MRTYIKLLCCLFMFSSSAAICSEESSLKDVGVSSVLRTTIFVRDLDSALELSQGIPGLKVKLDLPPEGETVNRVLGARNKKSRIVILQSGEDAIGNIDVIYAKLKAGGYTIVSPPMVFFQSRV